MMWRCDSVAFPDQKIHNCGIFERKQVWIAVNWHSFDFWPSFRAAAVIYMSKQTQIMSFCVLTSKLTGVQFHHILRGWSVMHKHLPRDFSMSIELPLFQHSLTRGSKDWKKEHIRYETFCKTHFLRQKIPPPRIKLFGKLRFAWLFRKSSNQ